jgi:hypothetical protein
MVRGEKVTSMLCNARMRTGGLQFVRQVTQGVGHGCHESIDDANYDGDLATYMRK